MILKLAAGFLKIKKMKLGREPNEREKSPGLFVGSFVRGGEMLT